MTVRPECLHTRSLSFSLWLRGLSDPITGLTITNLDWIFWNWKTKQLMFCEEKCHNGKISKYFDIFCKEVLSPGMKEYCENNNIEYRGFHVITFDGLGPTDSKHIMFDDREVSSDELKKILRMDVQKNTEDWM